MVYEIKKSLFDGPVISDSKNLYRLGSSFIATFFYFLTVVVQVSELTLKRLTINRRSVRWFILLCLLSVTFAQPPESDSDSICIASFNDLSLNEIAAENPLDFSAQSDSDMSEYSLPHDEDYHHGDAYIGYSDVDSQARTIHSFDTYETMSPDFLDVTNILEESFGNVLYQVPIVSDSMIYQGVPEMFEEPIPLINLLDSSLNEEPLMNESEPEIPDLDREVIPIIISGYFEAYIRWLIIIPMLLVRFKAANCLLVLISMLPSAQAMPTSSSGLEYADWTLLYGLGMLLYVLTIYHRRLAQICLMVLTIILGYLGFVSCPILLFIITILVIINYRLWTKLLVIIVHYSVGIFHLVCMICMFTTPLMIWLSYLLITQNHVVTINGRKWNKKQKIVLGLWYIASPNLRLKLSNYHDMRISHITPDNKPIIIPPMSRPIPRIDTINGEAQLKMEDGEVQIPTIGTSQESKWNHIPVPESKCRPAYQKVIKCSKIGTRKVVSNDPRGSQCAKWAMLYDHACLTNNYGLIHSLVDSYDPEAYDEVQTTDATVSILYSMYLPDIIAAYPPLVDSSYLVDVGNSCITNAVLFQYLKDHKKSLGVLRGEKYNYVVTTFDGITLDNCPVIKNSLTPTESCDYFIVLSNEEHVSAHIVASVQHNIGNWSARYDEWVGSSFTVDCGYEAYKVIAKSNDTVIDRDECREAIREFRCLYGEPETFPLRNYPNGDYITVEEMIYLAGYYGVHIVLMNYDMTGIIPMILYQSPKLDVKKAKFIGYSHEHWWTVDNTYRLPQELATYKPIAEHVTHFSNYMPRRVADGWEMLKGIKKLSGDMPPIALWTAIVKNPKAITDSQINGCQAIFHPGPYAPGTKKLVGKGKKSKAVKAEPAVEKRPEYKNFNDYLYDHPNLPTNRAQDAYDEYAEEEGIDQDESIRDSEPGDVGINDLNAEMLSAMEDYICPAGVVPSPMPINQLAAQVDEPLNPPNEPINEDNAPLIMNHLPDIDSPRLPDQQNPPANDQENEDLPPVIVNELPEVDSGFPNQPDLIADNQENVGVPLEAVSDGESWVSEPLLDIENSIIQICGNESIIKPPQGLDISAVSVIESEEVSRVLVKKAIKLSNLIPLIEDIIDPQNAPQIAIPPVVRVVAPIVHASPVKNIVQVAPSLAVQKPVIIPAVQVQPAVVSPAKPVATQAPRIPEVQKLSHGESVYKDPFEVPSILPPLRKSQPVIKDVNQPKEHDDFADDDDDYGYEDYEEGSKGGEEYEEEEYYDEEKPEDLITMKENKITDKGVIIDLDFHYQLSPREYQTFIELLGYCRHGLLNIKNGVDPIPSIYYVASLFRFLLIARYAATIGTLPQVQEDIYIKANVRWGDIEEPSHNVRFIEWIDPTVYNRGYYQGLTTRMEGDLHYSPFGHVKIPRHRQTKPVYTVQIHTGIYLGFVVSAAKWSEPSNGLQNIDGFFLNFYAVEVRPEMELDAKIILRAVQYVKVSLYGLTTITPREREFLTQRATSMLAHFKESMDNISRGTILYTKTESRYITRHRDAPYFKLDFGLRSIYSDAIFTSMKYAPYSWAMMRSEAIKALGDGPWVEIAKWGYGLLVIIRKRTIFRSILLQFLEWRCKSGSKYVFSYIQDYKYRCFQHWVSRYDPLEVTRQVATDPIFENRRAREYLDSETLKVYMQTQGFYDLDFPDFIKFPKLRAKRWLIGGLVFLWITWINSWEVNWDIPSTAMTIHTGVPTSNFLGSLIAFIYNTMWFYSIGFCLTLYYLRPLSKGVDVVCSKIPHKHWTDRWIHWVLIAPQPVANRQFEPETHFSDVNEIYPIDDDEYISVPPPVKDSQSTVDPEVLLTEAMLHNTGLSFAKSKPRSCLKSKVYGIFGERSSAVSYFILMGTGALFLIFWISLTYLLLPLLNPQFLRSFRQYLNSQELKYQHPNLSISISVFYKTIKYPILPPYILEIMCHIFLATYETGIRYRAWLESPWTPFVLGFVCLYSAYIMIRHTKIFTPFVIGIISFFVGGYILIGHLPVLQGGYFDLSGTWFKMILSLIMRFKDFKETLNTNELVQGFEEFKNYVSELYSIFVLGISSIPWQFEFVKHYMQFINSYPMLEEAQSFNVSRIHSVNGAVTYTKKNYDNITPPNRSITSLRCFTREGSEFFGSVDQKFQQLKAYLVANPGTVPTSGQKVVQTGPDMHTPMKKITPYYMEKNDTNLFSAIFARHTASKTMESRQSKRRFILKTRKIVEKYTTKLIEHFETHPVFTEDEYVASQDSISKRKAVQRGFDNFRKTQAIDLTLEVMMKTNEQHYDHLEDIRPRAVWCPDQTLRSVTGLYAKNLIIGMKATVPGFTHGLDCSGLAKKLEAGWKSILNAICGDWDGSAHDSNQHAWWIECIDIEIHKRLVPYLGSKLGWTDNQIQAVLRTVCTTSFPFRAYYTNLKTRTLMCSGRLDGTVFSGHPTLTTAGNTFRVCILIEFLRAEANIPESELFYTVAGDDVHFIINSVYKTKWNTVIRKWLSFDDGVFGIGYKLKKMQWRTNVIDFLSKTGAYNEVGTAVIHRYFHRTVIGGNYTHKLKKTFGPKEHRWAITSQLLSWIAGISFFEKYVDHRMKLPHQKPKKISDITWNDPERVHKLVSHENHYNTRNDYESIAPQLFNTPYEYCEIYRPTDLTHDVLAENSITYR